MISVVLGCYLLILLFPQLLFGQRLEYRGFTVYAHQRIDSSSYRLFDSAEALLRSSGLYGQRPAKIQVLLTDGFGEFAFLQPGAFAAFAATNPLTGRIVFSRTDLAANRAYRNGQLHRERRFSHTLAHEVTHVLLLERLGLFRFLSLARWKNEGYCDYIARESSYDYDAGIRQLCSGRGQTSASFSYFRYRLHMSLLLQEQHSSIEVVLVREYDTDTLDAAVRKHYCPAASPGRSSHALARPGLLSGGSFRSWLPLRQPPTRGVGSAKSS